MKRLHPVSMILGLVSGIVICLAVSGGYGMIRSAASSISSSRGMQQQRGSGQGLASMAQRLGMTQPELQKELASGRTIEQIAQERGVDISTLRRRGGSGSFTGMPFTASGSMTGSGSNRFGGKMRSGSGAFSSGGIDGRNR